MIDRRSHRIPWQEVMQAVTPLHRRLWVLRTSVVGLGAIVLVGGVVSGGVGRTLAFGAIVMAITATAFVAAERLLSPTKRAALARVYRSSGRADDAIRLLRVRRLSSPDQFLVVARSLDPGSFTAVDRLRLALMAEQLGDDELARRLEPPASEGESPGMGFLRNLLEARRRMNTDPAAGERAAREAWAAAEPRLQERSEDGVAVLCAEAAVLSGDDVILALARGPRRSSTGPSIVGENRQGG